MQRQSSGPGGGQQCTRCLVLIERHAPFYVDRARGRWQVRLPVLLSPGGRAAAAWHCHAAGLAAARAGHLVAHSHCITRTAQADELCRVCICAAMRQLLGEEENEILREAEEALSAAWAPLLFRELQ